MPLPHSLVGHRDRLKAVVRASGLGSLPVYQQVEFLLFFGIPYKDVQPLAKELLERYGSLNGICAAEREELLAFKNMTALAVDLFKALPEVLKLYLTPEETPEVLLGPNNVVPYIRERFGEDGKREQMYVLCMDKRQRLLHADKVDGTVANVSTTYRTVVELALKYRAEVVVLAHNHPSKFSEPSQDDLKSTRVLKDLLASLGVKLADHVVIAADCAYSMLLKMQLNVNDYAYKLDNLERYLRSKTDPTDE